MSKDLPPKILIDSDVIRHFIDGSRFLELQKIFLKRIIVVDKVKEEICRSKKYKDIFLNLLGMCKLEEVKLEDNLEAVIEYACLIKRFGEGESACMALAKFEKKYIASSNISDIKIYCKANKILYYTTMDI